MGRKCEKHPELDATAFCVKCGKPMCDDCVQKLSGRNFCTSCLGTQVGQSEISKEKKDPVVVKRKPRPDDRDRVTPAKRGKKKPSPAISMKEVRRVVASAIDFVLLIVVSVPVSWFLMQVTKLPFSEVNGFGFRLSFYIVFMLLSSFYFIFLHWRYGKTAGKLLMSLRVVGYAGNDEITLMQSVWRWIGFMTGGIWAFIGYWIASHSLGWLAIFKDKFPPWMVSIALLGGIVFTGMFSLGLLITFVGKYKRGFHDLLGATIVQLEIGNERRSASGSKNRQVSGDGA